MQPAAEALNYVIENGTLHTMMKMKISFQQLIITHPQYFAQYQNGFLSSC